MPVLQLEIKLKLLLQPVNVVKLRTAVSDGHAIHYERKLTWRVCMSASFAGCSACLRARIAQRLLSNIRRHAQLSGRNEPYLACLVYTAANTIDLLRVPDKPTVCKLRAEKQPTWNRATLLDASSCSYRRANPYRDQPTTRRNLKRLLSDPVTATLANSTFLVCGTKWG